jgi:two-component system chemotaxis sensor kinase CheA
VPARRKRGATKPEREFISEAEDILECLREGLAAFVDAEGGDPDPAVVNDLFRSAHSLKGLSGMFGFDALGELAHHLEDSLDDLRMGRARVDGPIVPLASEAVATFAAGLLAVGQGGTLDDVAASVADLRERLQAARGAPLLPEADLEALDLDAGTLRALTEYEEHRLRESLARGRRIHLVETCFEMVSFEEGLHELASAIREVGEVISTLPSPGDAPESQIRFSLIVAVDLDVRELASRLELEEGAVRAVGGGTRVGAAGSREPAPAPSSTPGEIDSLRSLSDTVRVDIKKLDDLMNLVGELVNERAALGDLSQRLRHDLSGSGAADDLQRIHKSLDRKLQELQAAVLEVRMVPLRQIFDKLSRVARRLRHDLGKQVRLEIRGADTELDKLIVEQLVDPLVHLVRNAFDHAIESEPERTAAGKPVEGSVVIEAGQRGNHVVIQVRDDGRGIDLEQVRARAVERGQLDSEARPSPSECLDLVFEPGLSTKAEVTGTSGRGVGLDVVRENLAATGGVVEIDSRPGRGTTFTLTLPITLAILQALLVRASDQTFALPLNAVFETLRIEEDTLQRSERREILKLRGAALPVLRLARVFDLPRADAGDRFAVIVGLGESRVALLVDRLEGQQDTVIKPIQGPVSQVRGIAGATELGRRGAVLVLDVSALVDELAPRREAAA